MVKKTLLFLVLVGLAISGCTRTWYGIKADTSDAITGTKEVIHDATAPNATQEQTVTQ
ncbi:MAG TPA: entericidin EcnAB [Sulfurovum sp.]|nr:entericidin EcnAB [Sulfurovum sp.]